MKELIEAVRAHKCLWNPTFKGYHDTVKKDMEWQKIVDTLNHPDITDVATAKAEWKKLRDGHRDSLKRFKPVDGVLRRNTWKYVDDMAFLLPHKKTRKRKTYIIPRSLKRHFSTDENSSENSAVVDPMPSSITIDMVECKPEIINGKNTELIEFMQDMSNNYEEEQEASIVKLDAAQSKHPIDLFFESMCETTKEFPPWLQKRVKRQIFNVIAEAEDLMDASGNSERKSILPCDDDL